VLLLLLLQIQFVPYHYGRITWTHRLTLLADLLLVWWLWRKILSGRGDFRRWRRWTSWAAPALGIASSIAALVFSWTIATFPGEWQEDHLPSFSVIPARWAWKERPRDEPGSMKPVSAHEWFFAGEVDIETFHRKSFFSSTLVLPGFNIYEALKIDDPKKVEWKEHLIDLRERHLEGADFGGANLTKANLIGAHLEGAQLTGARLQDALLNRAQLQGASLLWTQLQGARLIEAQLQGASLIGTQLQGAQLIEAQLQAPCSFKRTLRAPPSITHSFRARVLAWWIFRAHHSLRCSSRVQGLLARGFGAHRSRARSSRGRYSKIAI
jgi:hypothetical protein